MLDNNAPPLRGMLSGLRGSPGPIQSAVTDSAPMQKSRMWSTARNGLMTHGSAPTTAAMLQGAEYSGVRSGVSQIGRGNGTITKAANGINNAMTARNLGKKAIEKFGSGGAEAELAGAGEAAATAGAAEAVGGAVAAEGIGATVAELAPLLLL